MRFVLNAYSFVDVRSDEEIHNFRCTNRNDFQCHRYYKIWCDVASISERRSITRWDKKYRFKNVTRFLSKLYRFFIH